MPKIDQMKDFTPHMCTPVYEFPYNKIQWYIYIYKVKVMKIEILREFTIF